MLVTRLFIDLEMTGLQQHTTPVSLGIVSEDGEQSLYAEFNDYAPMQADQWLKDNVLSKLQFADQDRVVARAKAGPHVAMKGHRGHVATALRLWLEQFEQVEMWGDVLAYDWVLFCELLGGGVECLPKNVYYIPFDLASLLKVAGVDPDVNREEFAGITDTSMKHHALFDAKVQAACYRQVVTYANDLWSVGQGSEQIGK